jgi:hypothetical protein
MARRAEIRRGRIFKIQKRIKFVETKNLPKFGKVNEKEKCFFLVLNKV